MILFSIWRLRHYKFIYFFRFTCVPYNEWKGRRRRRLIAYDFCVLKQRDVCPRGCTYATWYSTYLDLSDYITRGWKIFFPLFFCKKINQLINWLTNHDFNSHFDWKKFSNQPCQESKTSTHTGHYYYSLWCLTDRYTLPSLSIPYQWTKWEEIDACRRSSTSPEGLKPVKTRRGATITCENRFAQAFPLPFDE